MVSPHYRFMQIRNFPLKWKRREKKKFSFGIGRWACSKNCLCNLVVTFRKPCLLYSKEEKEATKFLFSYLTSSNNPSSMKNKCTHRCLRGSNFCGLKVLSMLPAHESMPLMRLNIVCGESLEWTRGINIIDLNWIGSRHPIGMNQPQTRRGGRGWTTQHYLCDIGAGPLKEQNINP